MEYTGTDLIENIQDMLMNHEPEVLEEVYNELASEKVNHVGGDRFEIASDHVPWEEKTDAQKIDLAVNNIDQWIEEIHEMANDSDFDHDGIWQELGQIRWTLDYQLKPAVDDLTSSE